MFPVFDGATLFLTSEPLRIPSRQPGHPSSPLPLQMGAYRSLFFISLTSRKFSLCRQIWIRVLYYMLLQYSIPLYHLFYLTPSSLKVGKMSLSCLYSNHPQKAYSIASSQWIWAKRLNYTAIENSAVSSITCRNSLTREILYLAWSYYHMNLEPFSHPRSAPSRTLVPFMCCRNAACCHITKGSLG